MSDEPERKGELEAVDNKAAKLSTLTDRHPHVFNHPSIGKWLKRLLFYRLAEKNAPTESLDASLEVNAIVEDFSEAVSDEWEAEAEAEAEATIAAEVEAELAAQKVEAQAAKALAAKVARAAAAKIAAKRKARPKGKKRTSR